MFLSLRVPDIELILAGITLNQSVFELSLVAMTTELVMILVGCLLTRDTEPSQGVVGDTGTSLIVMVGTGRTPVIQEVL